MNIFWTWHAKAKTLAECKGSAREGCVCLLVRKESKKVFVVKSHRSFTLAGSPNSIHRNYSYTHHPSTILLFPLR
jgi:hypothetical protein